MSTHRRTWQKFEERVAALFGCRRQVLSGSSGRDDATASDSTHPALFVEAKFRARHTIQSLFDSTKALAKKEAKTPVIALATKNRPGFLIVIHSDDITRVMAEYAAAHATDELEGMIRRAYHRLHQTGELEEDEAA